ncbi:MAG: ABC transporter substrate-binding protein, partial [Oceanibaculum sp.]
MRISISCGAVGVELELCRDGVSAWAEKTGNRVDIVSTPNSSSERLALYQQMLAAGAGDIDVFQIDIVWPG